MEETELSSAAFILSLFFKPSKKGFRSARFSANSLQGKSFSVFISHGNCLIEQSPAGKQTTPTFTNTFTYPEDAETPENIQNISKEIVKTAEDVHSVKLDPISLVWGVNEGEEPFLIDIKTATFTPNNDLQNDLSFEYLLFIALEVAKRTEPNICITEGKSCVGGYLSIERKKVEAYKVSSFIQKLSVESKKDCFDYIMKKMSTLCPQMMISMCPVCPNCFKKYSKRIIFHNENKNKNKETAALRNYNSYRAEPSRPKTSQERSSRTRPMTSLEGSSRSRPMSSTMRTSSRMVYKTTPLNKTRVGGDESTKIVATNKTMHDARDIHELEVLSQSVRRSGTGLLRPTQAFSFKTYKQAYGLYHCRSGINSVIKN